MAPDVPPDFWENDDLRAALASRHMGKVIRAYRRHPWHGRHLRQGAVAGWAGVDQPRLSRIENGPAIMHLDQLAYWVRLLRIPQRYLWFTSSETGRAAAWGGQPDDLNEPRDGLTTVGMTDLLRRGLDDALTNGAVGEATLDDWERTVLRYGRETRDRPRGVLLADLVVDLTEVKQIMEQCRTASGLRRLTRVVAQMSGLVVLMLVKLDARVAFRRWARTTRVAAVESGDPITHSWVLAQEAYGHFYSGDPVEAIDVAQQAMEVADRSVCVGVPLAAALAARAQAALGSREEARAELARAEKELGRLDASARVPSAFGYSEAQLRFHEGNVYTRLHDSSAAFTAHERALELCAPGDYTDWALTRLDRASCLVYDGDVSGAMAYAIATLADLTEEQRQGIIVGRGHEIVAALPSCERALPPARELRELLIER